MRLQPFVRQQCWDNPSWADRLTGSQTTHWSLTTLQKELVRIGAKVTRNSKYVTFQLADVAVTRNLFAAILDRIERLTLFQRQFRELSFCVGLEDRRRSRVDDQQLVASPFQSHGIDQRGAGDPFLGLP